MSFRKKVSLKGIAETLGLSINTVSRALRDCSDISAGTKLKVREKAEEMGYYSSKRKDLAPLGKRPKCLGIILDEITNSYFLKVTKGLTRCLGEKGVEVLIFPTNRPYTDIEEINHCLYHSVDLCLSFLEVENSAIRYAKERGVEILLVGRESKSGDLSDIYADDYNGGEEASGYLLSKKCLSQMYIGLGTLEVNFRRFNGFLANSQKSGVSVLYYDWAELDKAVEEILLSGVNGVFCFNDELAVELIDRLRGRGADLSKIRIVGFDNILHESGYADYKFASISADYANLIDEISSFVARELNEPLPKTVKLKIGVKLDETHDRP
jgi:LacI family transcriptional regulator